MKLNDVEKKPCAKCPYKLGLVETLVSPCPQCMQNGYGKCSIRGKSQRTRINGTEYKSAVYWGIVMEEEYKKALEQISRKNLW